jgi:hypothetical protein
MCQLSRRKLWHKTAPNKYTMGGRTKTEAHDCLMDEGRKRVIGIMAAILTAMHENGERFVRNAER